MPELEFKCPECSKSIHSDDSLCGESLTCPSCSCEVSIPIPGLEKGFKLGDFEIIEKLGSGSMGEVWLAYQETMDRKVALKILAPKFASDARFIDRFMSEVKNSAKLSHPNIITAFYAGVDKGHYYLAITYIIGKNVDVLQREKGVFEENEALKIILSVVDALEYAWNEFKILHRDVKPSNIMINKNGEAMLLDLGIAKSLDQETDLTMTGTVLGTPFYISPEQAMGTVGLDFRTDIYSLGTTLYHMVTGTVPYNATTAMAIIMKHLNNDFPPPKDHNPDLSSECATLIEIMMSKDRDNRQMSWETLKKDIELVMNGEMPQTKLQSDETFIAEQSDINPEVKLNMDTSASSKKSHIIYISLIIIIAIIGLIVFINSTKTNENRNSAQNGQGQSNTNTNDGVVTEIPPDSQNDFQEDIAEPIDNTSSTPNNANFNRLKSINIAKILAQRNIVETLYGVKIRFIEEVTNISEGNFFGTTETKTGKRQLKGIEFVEKYDPKTDIAQVTAILKLKKIADIIDTDKFHLDKYPEKSIKRIAFASSSPENVKKLAALRAAEIEAYKNLYKRIGGFTLESQSKVENFILKSDKVKTSVIGALMGAEFMGFAWEGKGNEAIAVVKLRLNLKELADILGEKIIDFEGDFVEATGKAAQAETSGKINNKTDKTPQLEIIETDIDIMP